ncbi:glycosyl hydrolase 115 family protein [Bacteroides ovatus]|nr:glycosyl hydrolase 115 family protein [Bacteroides ovatus]
MAISAIFLRTEECARKGGNGVYYHVSYWGRPHDHLWLSTMSPYLIFQQMKLAYDRGIQKMWILNVGDIKPAEYQIELFMDILWNIEAVVLGRSDLSSETLAGTGIGSFVRKGSITCDAGTLSSYPYS